MRPLGAYYSKKHDFTVVADGTLFCTRLFAPESLVRGKVAQRSCANNARHGTHFFHTAGQTLCEKHTGIPALFGGDTGLPLTVSNHLSIWLNE